ncbi:MAG: hypothetical protein ACD_7C00126G0010 [uncultured bacterium]|nr:MAG: hypothetical protein ACD_7C00126G0010 [uncultured bacterium]
MTIPYQITRDIIYLEISPMARIVPAVNPAIVNLF